MFSINQRSIFVVLLTFISCNLIALDIWLLNNHKTLLVQQAVQIKENEANMTKKTSITDISCPQSCLSAIQNATTTTQPTLQNQVALPQTVQTVEKSFLFPWEADQQLQRKSGQMFREPKHTLIQNSTALSRVQHLKFQYIHQIVARIFMFDCITALISILPGLLK